MLHIINITSAVISRWAIDVIIIVLILWWVRRKKKRWRKFRKKILNRSVLLRVGLLIVVVYFVIPRGLGQVYPKARYFPSFVEAHKLRAYYMLYASIITPKSANQAQIERYITQAAQKYGVERALVRAVVKVESSFRQFAASDAGGCGLMQLLPNTYYSLAGGNPFCAKSNIMAGTKYLAQLRRRFSGIDPQKRKRLVVAAYNAGPSRVDRCKCVPAIRETQNYVARVMKYYNLYKQ